VRHRAGLLLLLPWILLANAGCQLQLDLNVAVEEDGSGQIEVVVGLDPDAIERIGGDLAAVLAIDDLEEAGWTVDGPTLDPDGYTRVRVGRPFADPDEAAQIFEQIVSAEGPFRDLAITRTDSFARTEWTFTGRIDFSGGIEAFGDSGIAAELDGEPLGQSQQDIEAQLGEPLSEAIDVRVGVRLPGQVTSNAMSAAEEGGRWQVPWGAEPLALAAQGEETRTATLVAAGVGAVCVALLVGLGVLRLVRGPGGSRRSGAHLVDDGA
jgi:hypothetical protein